MPRSCSPDFGLQVCVFALDSSPPLPPPPPPHPLLPPLPLLTFFLLFFFFFLLLLFLIHPPFIFCLYFSLPFSVASAKGSVSIPSFAMVAMVLVQATLSSSASVYIEKLLKVEVRPLSSSPAPLTPNPPPYLQVPGALDSLNFQNANLYAPHHPLHSIPPFPLNLLCNRNFMLLRALAPALSFCFTSRCLQCRCRRVFALQSTLMSLMCAVA